MFIAFRKRERKGQRGGDRQTDRQTDTDVRNPDRLPSIHALTGGRTCKLLAQCTTFQPT